MVHSMVRRCVFQPQTLYSGYRGPCGAPAGESIHLEQSSNLRIFIIFFFFFTVDCYSNYMEHTMDFVPLSFSLTLMDTTALSQVHRHKIFKSASSNITSQLPFLFSSVIHHDAKCFFTSILKILFISLR